MLFEQLRSGGCLSYVVGCEHACVGVVVDPALGLTDRYRAVANEKGLRIRYVIDTHTHADHFSAARDLAKDCGAHIVMHRASAAPFADLRVDDGELLIVGDLRIRMMHTPGHTDDSMTLVLPDRLLTGDTLLIGATGRTDLPSGDPEALYDSLFQRVLRLDPALKVCPAHDYKGRSHSTIGDEIATNPRLQKRERGAFVEMMRNLNLTMPTHVTEALRTNMSGGKTVSQLLAQAAATVPFMSMAELKARVEAQEGDLIVLDVRERDAYEAAHIPGARLLPRGQLELRVNQDLPDPTRRILACCELGYISTLAASTLREMGFQHAVALDGGMKAWRESGYPTKAGREP